MWLAEGPYGAEKGHGLLMVYCEQAAAHQATHGTTGSLIAGKELAWSYKPRMPTGSP
jgi:hypothetical protein